MISKFFYGILHKNTSFLALCEFKYFLWKLNCKLVLNNRSDWFWSSISSLQILQPCYSSCSFLAWMVAKRCFIPFDHFLLLGIFILLFWPMKAFSSASSHIVFGWFRRLYGRPYCRPLGYSHFGRFSDACCHCCLVGIRLYASIQLFTAAFGPHWRRHR